MIPSAAALTSQFYEWEQRGRGWHVAPFPCDLEPEFVPFFGHFIDQDEIIDDGRHPSWFDTLFGGRTVQEERRYEPKARLAHPYGAESDSLAIHAVTLPRQFKQTRERITQLLVMLSYLRRPVSFEIVATEDEITLAFVTHECDATFCHSQLRAFFPECAVRASTDDRVLELIEEAACAYTVDFGLSEECMRPLAVLSSDHDPYLPLLGILESLSDEEAVIIQILFCGVHNAWAESMQRAVTDDLGKTSFFIDAPEMPQLAREKVSQPLYGVTVRAIALSDTLETAAPILQQVAIALVHASHASSNSLTPLPAELYPLNVRLADMVLRETHRVGMLLNASELATFVHFPAIASKKLSATSSTTKSAPAALCNQPYVLGQNVHQRIEQEVGISADQRLRHIHILGATGTGKSTLIKSLVMQDIHAGTGLMCLDPHGDLIDDILVNIPQERIQDVVLIDPSDAAFPVSLNILVAHSDTEKELLASDLVAVFRRFSTSWGDAMNSVLAHAILAFLYNATQYHLGDLRRFLIEAPYRAHILSTVTDPDIAYYWQHEFPLLKSSSIGPILTRLDAFLRPKVIRNMICQTKSLDFAQLMDGSKIVLVKLSHGLLGEENSFLLGALIVSKLQQTAMARQSQALHSRVPFFCYIDEFQHFVTPSMATILTGTRKYGLGLVLCHQHMQQLSSCDHATVGSVLAVGTRVWFRLGDTDAKHLADGFSSFSADDLQNLPTGEAIARVNTRDADFNLTVMPYQSASAATYVEDIIAYTRDTYSVPIAPQTDTAPEPQPPRQSPRSPAPPEQSSAVPFAEEPLTAKREHQREHRYVQAFIKAMAESHGYRAHIEVPIPESKGLIDVVLEKGMETIAVEISVTTTAEWELHNVRKCLAAGYGRIIVCATEPNKVKSIQQRMSVSLIAEEQAKVQVISSADIPVIFQSPGQSQPTETLVKGYRVKVNYESNANRQDLLQSIIRAGKKP